MTAYDATFDRKLSLKAPSSDAGDRRRATPPSAVEALARATLSAALLVAVALLFALQVLATLR